MARPYTLITLAIASSVALLATSSLAFYSDFVLHEALSHPSTDNPSRPTIVMIGDSHFSFVAWRTLFDCESIANFAQGGRRTDQILDQLHMALALKPRLIIEMGGTNDLLQQVKSETAIANLREMKAEANAADVPLVTVSMPPIPGQENAVSYINAEASLSVSFDENDLRDDHIHLRRSGYAKIRDALDPLISKNCRD